MPAPRIAAGGTVPDPEEVTPLLGRRADPLGSPTPREHQVLALMAEGRTNIAVGGALVIGAAMVQKNVTSVFQKLGWTIQAQTTGVFSLCSPRCSAEPQSMAQVR